ncbi:MAG: biotin--[acetyl-CoA-carboxylase] ligase [Sulfolobus sp.]
MLVFKFPSVTSTQDLAEAIYRMINANEFVIVAEEQTEARGRYRRGWYSPKGGLWFTYVIKGFNPEKIPLATLQTALAVRESISQYVNALIRWPNDIVIDDRKVAGILIEGISEGGMGNKGSTVFIGVGIDTNVESFPPDINAISLLQLGKRIDNDEFLSLIINKIKEYLNLEQDRVIEEINKYLSIKNRRIKIIAEQEKVCKALFVDFMGRLVTDCGIFEVEDIKRVESLDT